MILVITTIYAKDEPFAILVKISPSFTWLLAFEALTDCKHYNLPPLRGRKYFQHRAVLRQGQNGAWKRTTTSREWIQNWKETEQWTCACVWTMMTNQVSNQETGTKTKLKIPGEALGLVRKSLKWWDRSRRQIEWGSWELVWTKGSSHRLRQEGSGCASDWGWNLDETMECKSVHLLLKKNKQRLRWRTFLDSDSLILQH